MSSSGIATPALVPHPLREKALSAPPPGFVVNAEFRTFDPGYDPKKPQDRFQNLSGARVNIVIKDLMGAADVPPIECVTDKDGLLCAKGTTTAPVINNVGQYAGRVLFFEVLGPAGKTTDLTDLKYKSNGIARYFPISKWSTRWWAEPNNLDGTPGATGTITLQPGLVNLGNARAFTVGCFIDIPLTFTRSDGSKALFPENVDLKASPIHKRTSPKI